VEERIDLQPREQGFGAQTVARGGYMEKRTQADIAKKAQQNIVCESVRLSGFRKLIIEVGSHPSALSTQKNP
jgi:hypothetical protein